jgi:hypothetical protein
MEFMKHNNMDVRERNKATHTYLSNEVLTVVNAIATTISSGKLC